MAWQIITSIFILAIILCGFLSKDVTKKSTTCLLIIKILIIHWRLVIWCNLSTIILIICTKIRILIWWWIKSLTTLKWLTNTKVTKTLYNIGSERIFKCNILLPSSSPRLWSTSPTATQWTTIRKHIWPSYCHINH